jgi:hypothetical protein
MSTFPKIDHVLIGVVVAYDADTGEVLDVNERFVETVDGKPGYATEITPTECDEIRADLARSFPERRLDVLVAPREMVEREKEVPVAYHVDPMTRKLRVEPERDLITEATETARVKPKGQAKKKKPKEKKAKKKTR